MDPSTQTLCNHVLRLLKDNGHEVSTSRMADGRVRVSTPSTTPGVKWEHTCTGEDAEYRALCMLAVDVGIDLS